ncbi:helix-turn-helix domain-containing protein [Streptococcus thoraltensis]|uniref:helix-turn-helix domain-containing protein n=1 Tax=Streptococcus thoraltensis TaxID=55085 RepID=UPI0003606BBF|nr:helix-turn-helix domain-containing protein [Streptococcus thoraltensis]MDY4761523.1 helix-turn-helix domain-containing protein [Streptococcus thoraltensis]
MKLSLQELLICKPFRQADLLASNEKSLLKKFINFTIMDTPTIDDWIVPNELLIIGNFMETHLSINFIRRLKHKGVTAIVSKKKFKIHVDKTIRDFLLDIDLPIIFVDNDYSWSELTREIHKLSQEQQNIQMQEIEKFHHSLLNYLSDSKSMNELCSIVYNMTGISLSIINPNMEIIDASFESDWQSQITLFKRILLDSEIIIGYDIHRQAVYGHSFINNQDNSYKYYQIPIIQKGKLIAHTFLKMSKDSTLSSEIIARIKSIQSIFLLRQAIFREIRQNNQRYRNLILEELLTQNTEHIQYNKDSYSLSLGSKIETNYYLVIISSPDLEKISFIKRENNLHRLSEDLISKVFNNENILVFNRGSYLILLYGREQQEIKRFIDSLVHFINHNVAYNTYSIGVSNLHSYYKLDEAYKEAEQAYLFTKNNPSSSRCQYYQQLGILQLFLDDDSQLNHAMIDRLLKQYIDPLKIYDREHHTDLINTLTQFFANNLNHQTTAQKLFIHKNTLRFRLQKIEELLRIDLKQLNSILHLNLSIYCYHHYHTHSKPSSDYD